MINKFLRYFIPSLDEHLSDDRLASLFCNELTFTERIVAKRHLAQCWHCRFRRDDLGGRRADEVVDLYRAVLSSKNLKLPSEPREEFGRKLDIHLQQLQQQPWWVFRLPRISLSAFNPMNPALAACGVLGLAIAVSLLSWWQRSVPDITSNALLVRAQRWDSTNLSNGPGVVYQVVRITAPKISVDRSIYRDLQGKRKQKPARLAEKQETLKAELMKAGVNWNEPISASDYQTWHDHQHVRSDKITRAGAHLLKLTTTVPDSSVPVQSLTVRDTDFHPVRRTVDLHDIGTVEIAELDFKILPFSAVDADVFEPLSNFPYAGTTSRGRVLQFPLPHTVTDIQLDESELSARLILNQLHADSGEQLEIHREPQGILIEGVVETDERKRELQAQLRIVPHVMVSIQSDADLKNAPAGDNPTQIQTASLPDQPSPLESLLKKHGRSVEEINSLAQRFFATAIAVSQESRAIVDLQTRFSHEGQSTVLAAATLSELIYSHRERLDAGLKSERVLISEVVTGHAVAPDSVRSIGTQLQAAAERNLLLTKELTQTDTPATRDAEQILAEISVSVDELATASNEIYGKPPSASTLSGKK